MLANLFAVVAITASKLVLGAPSSEPSLLIFSKTAAYRHESIPNGIDLVTSIAKSKGWSVAASEDSSIFINGSLSGYTTLVFISTSGNFLSSGESDALNQFLLNGGSWLGIHAASDFGDDMPAWLTKLVGAQFRSHPCFIPCSAEIREIYPPYGNIRLDIVTIQDFSHPATADLPHLYNRTDEWYAFKTNPVEDPLYTVVATLEETYIDEITSTNPDYMAPLHLIAWYSTYEGVARTFYTGMGHTVESFSEDYFIKHVTGGLEWVTGA